MGIDTGRMKSCEKNSKFKNKNSKHLGTKQQREFNLNQ